MSLEMNLIVVGSCERLTRDEPSYYCVEIWNLLMDCVYTCIYVTEFMFELS